MIICWCVRVSIKGLVFIVATKFKLFSSKNSTASKFTTLSLCIQDLFRWVMQQLLCSSRSKNFFAFVLMEHSPKSVEVAWMWICPGGNWHLGLTSNHSAKILFLPRLYYELWEWHRLRSGTREFYFRVLGALRGWGTLLAPSGGGGLVWWRTFLHWKCQHFPRLLFLT